MGKKEKNTSTPKNKRLLDVATAPEQLAKAGKLPASQSKKESGKEEQDFYSKPIFKSRRFDLF